MAKNIVVLVILVATVVHSSSCFSQVNFVPAKFRDLTVGKSTGEAVRKSLGNSLETHRDDSKRTWLYYENIGPVAGGVVIVLNPKDILEMVEVRPDQLTIDQAKKVFGADFRLIRYDWDNCLDTGGEAPIFESVNGPIAFIVYAKLGIAFSANQDPVQIIDYTATPPGGKRSRCPSTSPK